MNSTHARYLLAALAALATACATPQGDARCDGLADQYRLAGTLAAGLGAVTAGGVVATSTPQDGDTRTAYATGTLLLAGASAAVAYLWKDLGQTLARECVLVDADPPQGEGPWHGTATSSIAH